ncbi:HD domain-containing protein [Alkalihalobacillus oceani]|uniref:HD domain-containing protein n=1 Tax=Halalkalibacter oceani TaxID=1653776 RepID=UPI00203F8CFC|nr:HD domain-containing protein [Halalkalibacter oceani]MCM3761863.1 HD domain-containing protein [Halalkalibacter oceani]
MKDAITRTTEWVKAQLEHEGTGHDWEHIRRVTSQAQEIAEIEGADRHIVTLAALLHDLIDDKVVASEEEGLAKVNKWLEQLALPTDAKTHIIEIITTMSFKGGNNKPMSTLEGQIVQDADRLDALGAIGIARTFLYAGSKGQPMYDPAARVRENMTVEQYRNGKSSAVHHFYEKLLKLKSLMNTNEAKRRAERRHAFMEQFLEQFYQEWD